MPGSALRDTFHSRKVHACACKAAALCKPLLYWMPWLALSDRVCDTEDPLLKQVVGTFLFHLSDIDVFRYTQGKGDSSFKLYSSVDPERLGICSANRIFMVHSG